MCPLSLPPPRGLNLERKHGGTAAIHQQQWTPEAQYLSHSTNIHSKFGTEKPIRPSLETQTPSRQTFRQSTSGSKLKAQQSIKVTRSCRTINNNIRMRNCAHPRSPSHQRIKDITIELRGRRTTTSSTIETRSHRRSA